MLFLYAKPSPCGWQQLSPGRQEIRQARADPVPTKVEHFLDFHRQRFQCDPAHHLIHTEQQAIVVDIVLQKAFATVQVDKRGQMVRGSSCQPGDGPLNPDSVDCGDGIVVPFQFVGLLLDENGINQDFKYNVPQEAAFPTFPFPENAPKSSSQSTDRFKKHRSAVKPAIVFEMLQNAGGNLTIKSVEFAPAFSNDPFAHSDLTIDDAQPVWNRQPSQKLGTIQPGQGMGKVIHEWVFKFRNAGFTLPR